jgi:hypothetical protein
MEQKAYIIAMRCNDSDGTSYNDYINAVFNTKEEAEERLQASMKAELGCLNEDEEEEEFGEDEGSYELAEDGETMIVSKITGLSVTEYSIIEINADSYIANLPLETIVRAKDYKRFITELFMYEKQISKEKAEKLFEKFMDSDYFTSFLNEELFDDMDEEEENEE